MELPEQLKTKDIKGLEEWFVNSLSAETLPFEHMTAVLTSLGLDGQAELADNWAELLQDTLAERGDKIATIKLLQRRSAWGGDDPEFGELCVKSLFKVFKGQIGQSVVKSVGFDGKTAPIESLRRLALVMALKPDVLCRDKTWGFGVVGRVDDFYLKVTIDFDRKPGHQMSFAYAGEALEILGDEHILARKHRNPEEFGKLLKNNQAEIIRIAIRSFGPLSINQIKDIFVPDIMPEAGWKSFWEAARKGLKADPLANVPTGRDKPIRLLDRATDQHEELLATLRSERDSETILRLAQKLEQMAGKGGISDNVRSVCAERLAFALKGARGRAHWLVARVILEAKSLGISNEIADYSAAQETMFTPEIFLAASEGMPAKEVGGLIELLTQADAAKATQLFVSTLFKMQMNVLNDVMDYLVSSGQQKICTENFRPAVRAGSASLEVLYWLCRHLDEAESWEVGSLADILIKAVNSLEENRSGRELQTQKQLRALFGQKAWLEEAMSRLDGRRRESLLSKINTSTGWDSVEQRSVMATIIKLYPELGKVVASETKEDESQTKLSKFTSWRTYNQRKEQLRRLIEEDVPKNSREIGIARSYGDLRENAEYKAAKEHQSILMRRQGEWETGLREIKGSDFSGFPTDKAGMGTCVTLAGSDGRIERHTILGEWDGDEELGIISSSSAIAHALMSHKAGEDVVLPGVVGEETWKITAVTGLSDVVKKWIAG